ncbi:RNA-binding domain-containing protein [Aaosphaeria arxii CBS 175.79]|uniref:RNA-binding domain-containing protein n=1 Tax=Aaosphaeria arxii CBS 175.79 TaxID=1450172 RepID=A0A6A5XJ34_9PLEO|nr:RNA-binding domain-containing protein [Aaosphaeria arxii CBS 175.79]KAF2013285.1 RNA-binding domain-containing protein [Aaosphaeria arxii CBS 175.79]
MYLLRRTAARAVSSKAIFTQPRSVAAITPASLKLHAYTRIIPAFQRRFASDDATKITTESISNATAQSEAPEAFAQTAAEAPIEENLTPVQAAAEAPPTNASATVGADALAAAAQTAQRSTRRSRFPLREPSAPAEPSNVIYVGNLYYEVGEEQIQNVFSKFGEIESLAIARDNRGISRGFAHVTYKKVADADMAIQNLDMQVFEGRNLVVQYHKPREVRRGGQARPADPTKTLFIGNMSFEMTDKDLNELFRDIRNVTEVRVAIDRRTGVPRGFSHADFLDVASATAAKEFLAEKTIYGRTLRVDYSKSTRQSPQRNGASGESQSDKDNSR